MGKPFWTGSRLSDLLDESLSIDDLMNKYVGQSRQNIKRRRQEARKRLHDALSKDHNESMEREPRHEPKGTEQSLGRLASTWEVVTKNADGEAEVHTMHKYEYDRSTKELIVEPVVAANIAPSRARIPKRDHKIIFVFSDSQIGYRRYDDELHPIHDEAAMRASVLFAQDLKPNTVVDNGDTVDFAELGRFAPDSDHFLGTLQPSLQRTHDFFAEMTAATPGAERVTVWSNHVKRLTDYLLKNAGVLYNIKAAGEKYPAMSYPGLLKLDSIGWQYVDGYPGEYEYAEDLAFMHGTFAVSNGSTASKLSNANYGRNVVQGHKHSIETHYQTDRRGRAFGAFVVGALCRIDGAVPSYHNSVGVDNRPVRHYENWQQGVMVIEDYGQGRYVFNQVPIHNGVIFWRGKVYDGNKEQA